MLIYIYLCTARLGAETAILNEQPPWFKEIRATYVSNQATISGVESLLMSMQLHVHVGLVL